ncbi:FMN reductase [Sinorhizobium medicae]|uniref:FMN reductase n=1 Tax=Sinorhizobium medicae TaxID=110321 RepID=UPI000FDB8255|nr:FMN reductase [Sinorhizobium medicae]MDX0494916.1 FMN reductase [Sinorhizobium medicae]MDX0994378.1 FMN reductase [Sinorhizobium medicae]MDX1178238.1 FMN reductase [Sinorhizobium medicae]RVI94730.1 FMN reductase [Sinorhizobium medicae]WQO62996.1 FMN reductase [Sinorhizobium medicae]
MPQSRVVGISGNITRPSKTRAFVDHIVHRLAVDAGASAQTFDIEDFGASLLPARRLDELAPEARYVVGQIVAADILVVGSPTFKGSYTGLFKHVFDLLDPASLRGKPIILAATGGGERHSLMVEHQMRPLFGFFEALAMPTAIYACDKDFADGALISEAIHARVGRAIEEATQALARPGKARLAA